MKHTVKISFVKPGGAKIKYSILTMIFNLDTIIIFVQNVDKLKSFYVDMLQLEILEESKAEWLLLKAGNCQIGLHKIGEQYLAESKDEFKFDNNTKIVFQIEDDIYAVREQLLNKNVVVRDVKNFPGYDFLICDGADPEGNVFQIKQKKKL